MYLPFSIDDSGIEFHAYMNNNRYLVNRTYDTTVVGRYQASYLAAGIPLGVDIATISLLNDHDLSTGQSSRYQYLLSIAELNDAIIGNTTQE